MKIENCIAMIISQLREEEEHYRIALIDLKTELWQLKDIQQRIKSIKVFLQKLSLTAINM